MERRSDPAPRDVAVFGSCITRDSFNSRFNPGHKATYNCVLLQNQMSLISLMSEPVHEAWEPTRQMSEYDRWNVRTEFSKEFLSELVRLQPEYLVVDFFGDAHFGCVRLDDGRYITDNRWKVRRTDLYERLRDAERLERFNGRRDPDAYIEVWSDALERFASFVHADLPRTKVVVHHGHHTSWLSLPDQVLPVPLRDHRKSRRLHRIDIDAANALWRRLDALAVKALDATSIDLTGDVFPTYDAHPWGPFYVHYTPDYYQRFLAELHKIVTGAEGSASPHMVAEIELAARSTLERELATSQARLRQVEAQLPARGAGPARTSWRRALSRARRTRVFGSPRN